MSSSGDTPATDRRTSLANEIRNTLATRGLWAPKRSSDLITAVAQCADKLTEYAQQIEKLREALGEQCNCLAPGDVCHTCQILKDEEK